MFLARTSANAIRATSIINVAFPSDSDLEKRHSVSSKSAKRIVVIGGGITGLAAAHRLVEQNSLRSDSAVEVLLLEAAPRVGGVFRTDFHDGFLLEAGPDSFISEKPRAIDLVKRIGLGNHLIKTNREHRRSFVVRDGQLRQVPEGFQLLAPSRIWPFLTSDIFSWRGKARMALDLFLPRGASANGDDESLAHFVKRRLGQEVLERIAQPMVAGIYAADPETLSLRATIPRFLEMEQKHRSLILALRKQVKLDESFGRGTSGARYNLLFSFDQGMQMLVSKLEELLPKSSLRLNSRSESLRYDNSARQWRIGLAQSDSITADAVCVALPAYSSAHLLRDVDARLAAELASIPYASTATVNLAYRRCDVPHPLDGFGFVTPAMERRSTFACTFSSVKFAGRAPDGHVLLRAFVGGALQPEIFDLDEENILSRVRTDLRELLGIKAPPLFSVIEKWPRSMPQYHVGHIEKVAHIRSRVEKLKTLYLAGGAYDGVGIPDCIRSGEEAADYLLNALGNL